jgi:hypothetical protein
MKKASTSYPATDRPSVEWDLRFYLAGPNPKSEGWERTAHLSLNWRAKRQQLTPEGKPIALGDEIVGSTDRERETAVALDKAVMGRGRQRDTAQSKRNRKEGKHA